MGKNWKLICPRRIEFCMSPVLTKLWYYNIENCEFKWFEKQDWSEMKYRAWLVSSDGPVVGVGRLSFFWKWKLNELEASLNHLYFDRGSWEAHGGGVNCEILILHSTFMFTPTVQMKVLPIEKNFFHFAEWSDKCHG